MNLVTAEQLATTLIYLHLPNCWKFEWHNKVNSLGTCNEATKTIYLSVRWTRELTEEDVTDTILHEIAHAIAGCYNGHNHIWKQACISIGAIPERLAKVSVKRSDVAIPAYKLVAPDGTVIKEYFRKPNASVYAELQHYYQIGKKAATLGKLKIVKVDMLDLL